MEPDELDEVDAVTQLSFLIHGALEQRAGEDDLSLIQVRLLGVLRDRRPTMNQLAALLDLDKSGICSVPSRPRNVGR